MQLPPGSFQLSAFSSHGSIMTVTWVCHMAVAMVHWQWFMWQHIVCQMGASLASLDGMTLDAADYLVLVSNSSFGGEVIDGLTNGLE